MLVAVLLQAWVVAALVVLLLPEAWWVALLVGLLLVWRLLLAGKASLVLRPGALLLLLERQLAAQLKLPSSLVMPPPA